MRRRATGPGRSSPSLATPVAANRPYRGDWRKSPGSRCIYPGHHPVRALHWIARESASFAFAARAWFRRRRWAVRRILPLAPHNAHGSRQNRTPAVLCGSVRTGGPAGWCGGGPAWDFGRAGEKSGKRDMRGLSHVLKPRQSADAMQKRTASPLVQHVGPNCTPEGKSNLFPPLVLLRSFEPIVEPLSVRRH